jgi:hypothetical protein
MLFGLCETIVNIVPGFHVPFVLTASLVIYYHDSDIFSHDRVCLVPFSAHNV